MWRLARRLRDGNGDSREKIGKATERFSYSIRSKECLRRPSMTPATTRENCRVALCLENSLLWART